MANKDHFYYRLIMIFFFIAIAHNVFAQDLSSGTRPVHRLTWKSEYAIRYEVIIQRLVNKDYEDFLNDFTTETYIEVSLPVGQYRFQIIPYDMLEHQGEASNWAYLQVLPIVRTVQAEPEPEPEPEPKEPKPPYDPFKTYQIKLSAAWAPLYSAYGEVFGNESITASAVGRLSFCFRMPMDIYIGPELAVNWHTIEEENYLAAGVNILAVKWMDNERLSFGLRIGAQTPVVPEMTNKIMVTTGATFNFYITKRISLEAGFDYLHLFDEVYSGAVYPWIGLGFLF